GIGDALATWLKRAPAHAAAPTTMAGGKLVHRPRWRLAELCYNTRYRRCAGDLVEARACSRSGADHNGGRQAGTQAA
ncbi:hypothetical protein VS877_22490, partial [Salmonella enterica subsp. enterica serovar Paratyphi A]|nr:hypothetical protein [Salmonella enterica subsp. enterica serovar Paratyphi A]